jgi:NAD-dependent deacetylase
MEFASLSAFRKHPKKFFRWIQPLLSAALKARPNPAHEAIAQLERDSYLWGVITQNIDGLHKRAGTRNVAEIHGDLSTFSCQACHARVASGKLVQEFNRKEEVPSCASCGGYLKPDIVLFEEPLPEAEWMKAVTMAQRSDLFIVTGSSLEVYPAASLPQVAKENNAKLVINTLLPTGLDAYADLVLRFDVVDIWVGLKRKIYG